MYKKTFFLADGLAAILTTLIVVSEYEKVKSNIVVCEEKREVIINKITLENPTLKDGSLKKNSNSIAPYYYELSK